MKKVITYVVLPLVVLVLGYIIYTSIQEPVVFEKQRKCGYNILYRIKIQF